MCIACNAYSQQSGLLRHQLKLEVYAQAIVCVPLVERLVIILAAGD